MGLDFQAQAASFSSVERTRRGTETKRAVDELKVASLHPDVKQRAFGLEHLRRGGKVEGVKALTDPCTQSRSCLAPWIPTPAEAPDGNQLNAVDRNGNPL